MRKTVGNWYINKIGIPLQIAKIVMESAKDVGVQSDLPVFWSREATLALLNAYEVQRDRLGKDFRFKNYMWVAISLALKNEMGMNFTPAQCENRWRVLLRSYKRAMDNNLKLSRRRKDFVYQDAMQKILKGEDIIRPVSQSDETGVLSSGGKSNVQVGNSGSEPETVPNSGNELLINSGKSNANSEVISSEPEPTAGSGKQLFIIRGNSSVNSDGISSEPAPLPSKNFFIISTKPTMNSDVICRPSETEPSLNSGKQLFIITGKPCVNNDRISGEPEPAPGSNKQLFIISAKTNGNSDRINSEPALTPSSSKQLLLISGKSNGNSDGISSEPELTPSSSSKQLSLISGKSNGNSDGISSEPELTPSSSSTQLLLISGKSNVNSDRSSNKPEPPPSSNEPAPAASSSKQLFTNPSESSVSPPEKRRKLKQSFLQQIRADRKLYYEKKLEVDRERLEGLERRNDELLQLKKMKLQQAERMIAFEEEKLKCEKEKLVISSEKLKMYRRLVQLQEESNDILRSINDQFDFLL
ncbi:suppressor protein SRP40-like [Schistocerca piceifrons]|uniref:suppressor protein SRP40-like n=1 Tax=Schistocerca piceifrons TaxID=274613 RepID=UPI001F5E7790|nr:suppressor protein SRP40-like [Schistocerca piceifrons]